MAAFKTLDDYDLTGKRVLVRADLNVPVADGEVTDATRIERLVPTLREIIKVEGKAIILSHFGRPKGKEDKYSLAPVADRLSELLGKKVTFVEDCIGDTVANAVGKMANGDVALLENGACVHAGGR